MLDVSSRTRQDVRSESYGVILNPSCHPVPVSPCVLPNHRVILNSFQDLPRVGTGPTRSRNEFGMTGPEFGMMRSAEGYVPHPNSASANAASAAARFSSACLRAAATSSRCSALRPLLLRHLPVGIAVVLVQVLDEALPDALLGFAQEPIVEKWAEDAVVLDTGLRKECLHSPGRAD